MSAHPQRRQSIVGSITFNGPKRYEKREYAEDSVVEKLLQPYGMTLTAWQLIITNEVEGKWFKRAPAFIGSGAATNLFPTKPKTPGVYEIALAHVAYHHPDGAYAEYIPVYVGSTNDFRTRILYQYANDGSKLAHMLRPYMEAGFQLIFRWAYSPNKTTAAYAESALLGSYDYSMACQQNPPYRDAIWTPQMRVGGATVRMVAFRDRKVSTLRNLAEIAMLIRQEAAEAEILQRKEALEKELADKRAENEAELDRLQKAAEDAAFAEANSTPSDPASEVTKEDDSYEHLLLKFAELSTASKEKFRAFVVDSVFEVKIEAPTSDEVKLAAELTTLMQALPSFTDSAI